MTLLALHTKLHSRYCHCQHLNAAVLDRLTLWYLWKNNRHPDGLFLFRKVRKGR